MKWTNATDAFDFSSSDSSCLNDAPAASAEKLYESNTKPGTIYSANQQCKLMLGKEAEICEGVHATGQVIKNFFYYQVC